jgi:FkbM family methyltransferase
MIGGVIELAKWRPSLGERAPLIATKPANTTGEMMQLSYAQNLEDYHLELMFAGQEEGTYVDVGGGHPVADNVSFWFYLKGWRGLVVEPQQALADIYAYVRPRDHTVSCLAGASEGEAQFHVVEKLHGFSSTVREHAQAAAEFGAAFKTITKQVRRLAALSAEAGLTAIDFLKIDVEGAEAQVLAGMDFSRFRPRVILLEAVAPGSMEDASAAWERDLLAHGYRFAFFDRLNRFYVAEEAKELAARLPAQPAPWDKVGHLWDCGRAPERTDHPDHVLAKTLIEGFFAELPSLDPALLRRLIECGLNGVSSRALGVASAAGGTGGSDPMSANPASALLGTAEFPRPPAPPPADLAALLETDQLRAALGRIACMYDGGHLLE